MPGSGGGPGRGSELYHETAEGEAQGIMDVKKLSKESASAADHAQINTTSTKVWASFPDVRQRPRGRPKYSTCVIREQIESGTEREYSVHRLRSLRGQV